MTDPNHIIEGCRNGNRTAMKMLYEQHSARLLIVCRRYANNNEEAKDWLHEGWIRVFDTIKSFRGDGAIEGWLYMVMKNTALQMLHKQQKIKFLPLEEEENYIHDIQEGEFEELMDAYSAEVLLQIMQLLSPQYKLVLNLYVIDNLSHKEIASQLGISENTSKSNLNRARKQLIEILRNKMRTEKNKNLRMANL